MRYLIKGGRLVDPSGNIDEELDLLVAGGVIEKVGPDLSDDADSVMDATGKIIAPGLVDLHTHLREPGREDKETVASGTRSAIKGGFTSVACMPNTEPALDSAEVLKKLNKTISKEAAANVFIIGAITKGRAGKELTDFSALKGEGAKALSDDGSSVADKDLMLKALKEAKKEGLLIIEHCEDASISGQGVMSKGFIATKMGLRGIPREAEYKMIERDLELVKRAGGKLHVAHVSCAESVALIRKAKKSGVAVTAETCPHYLALTDECCVTYDTNTKMNPPLRSKEDVAALKAGLKDGTIDVIATDHAPHTDSEKDVEFDYAPFGVIGLETALSISIMELVAPGILTWVELIGKLSSNPSSILGIKRGSLKKGAVADLVIVDPAKEYIYSKEAIESRSKNSPFLNWRLKGKIETVLVGGKMALEMGAVK